MNGRGLILILSLLALLPACASSPVRPSTDCVIQVAEPRPGQEVASGITVEGTASFPPGQYLWVFARRTDFAPVWWPQGEAVIDPNTDQWKVFANIGRPQDIGWDFDLAVAVFARKQHLELQAILAKAMQTGEFRPIEMPATVCPPVLRAVKKTSHD